MYETQHGRPSSRSSLIEYKVFSTSYFHFIISICSHPEIRPFGDKLGISVSPSVYTHSEEMSHLLEGSVLALNTSCDQCSHCVALMFSIRVASIILESAENRSLPDLHTAFESVRGMLAEKHDLRSGFMVASAMLCQRQWNDEESLTYQPQNTFLTELFAAYRER